jgi:hypothetical protein
MGVQRTSTFRSGEKAVALSQSEKESAETVEPSSSGRDETLRD